MIREIYIEPENTSSGQSAVIRLPHFPGYLEIVVTRPGESDLRFGTIAGREKLEQLKAMIEEMLKG